MSTYTSILLKPVCKAIVLALFTALFAASVGIALGITHSLDMKETILRDSFVRTYMADLEKYNNKGNDIQTTVQVVFRDVDVSDYQVQVAMKKYVDDLVDTPYVSSPPVAFWLRDFDEFLYYNSDLRNDRSKSFEDKLDVFLATPPYDNVYPGQITRGSNGTVIASWLHLTFDQVSIKDGLSLVDVFRAQQNVTVAQPINQDSLEGPFFTHGEMYYMCEMWAVLPHEVTKTLIAGIASLFVISLIFTPHSIAAFILTPIVFSIFVEVVAVIRLVGLHFDPFTTIGLITCLGIVMDYNLHVCQAYLEIKDNSTRNEKVKKTMECMGRSVMQCGFTNFLSVLPLAFTSSLGYQVIFITFLAFTVIGIAHGLIFLPVVLSLIGPVKKDNGNEHSVKEPESGECPNTEVIISGKEAKDDLSLNELDI